jgi:pimeloyl-ACP methyl ester carboxylesterase
MNYLGRALCLAVATGMNGTPARAAQDDGEPAAAPGWGTGVRAGRSVIVLSAGDTVAVTSIGSGPAIIVVPGLLGAGYSFRHVIPALVSSGHRVIVVEPLGTGASARPEHGDYTLEGQALRILHVMNAAAVRSATFVCHSVGGSICYRLALRAPDRVDGIVAINGGPDEHAATAGLRRALKFTPIIRLLGSSAMRGKLRDGLMESSADPGWVTDEVVAEYTAPFGEMGPALRGLNGMARAKEPIDLTSRLRDLKIPVVLLVGTGSAESAMSPEVLTILEDQVSGITIERIENAGQYIQEEAPAAVIDAVHALRRAATLTLVPHSR